MTSPTATTNLPRHRRRRRRGRLFCLRPYRDLGPSEVAALEQAGTYLSLEAAKQQAVHAIEQRFAAEVLDMVQAGSSREADVAERLRAFGVDPASPVAALAIAVPSAGPGQISHDAETVADLLLDQGLAALVVRGSRETIAFVSWPRAEQMSLRTVGEELQRRIFRSHGTGRVLVAIGGVSPNSAGLGTVLMQARETCRAMQAQTDGPVVLEFGDVDSHRLLVAMLDRETHARFSRGGLGELRAQIETVTSSRHCVRFWSWTAITGPRRSGCTSTSTRSATVWPSSPISPAGMSGPPTAE